MKEYLEIGKIVNRHGLNGTVKVMPWCDSPEFLCEFDVLYRGKLHVPVEIEHAAVQKNMVLMKQKGLSEPEAHRAMQQYAMNHGMKMAEFAARILEKNEE